MAHTLSLKDFEPNVFLLKDYIEKLAKMDPSTGVVSQNVSERRAFDAMTLLSTFKESVHHLKELSDRNQRRVEKLEQVLCQDEREHEARMHELDQRYSEAFENFHELEDRISVVATKVVHLGDQLESSNVRRTRDFEASTLMKYLAEFYAGPKPTSMVFTDPGQCPQAADIIYKLNLLAQELPNDKFQEVKYRISEYYVKIETMLVNMFKEAHLSADFRRMKMYIGALQQFQKGYNDCVVSFVDLSVEKISGTQGASTEHIFLEIEKHCTKVKEHIDAVFESPEKINTRFIQSIFEKILKKHVQDTLEKLRTDKRITEYLQRLHDLFTRSTRLANKLNRSDSLSDPTLLNKLIRGSVFSEYLSFYSTCEVEHLQKKCNNMLNQYYDTLEIPKRTQAGLRSRAVKVIPDETYISDDVCSSIIYESKKAVNRAKELISGRELSDTVTKIYRKVLDMLCSDHFDYALDIVYSGMPSSQPHTAPTGQFFQVVGMINSHMPLIENLFREVIAPCIKYPEVVSTCLDTKRKVINSVEQKVEQGIIKCLNCMINWIKKLLSSQPKSDFRPDEMPAASNSTSACGDVVFYISECYRVISDSLDGKNREIVLTELGTRFHRVIYEHIQLFTFNSMGGMMIICDINCYRKAIKLFDNSLLDKLFENLQSLCNVFIIAPENLKQVCSEEPLVGFERTVLMTMLQLRADYRKSKQFAL